MTIKYSDVEVALNSMEVGDVLDFSQRINSVANLSTRLQYWQKKTGYKFRTKDFSENHGIGVFLVRVR